MALCAVFFKKSIHFFGERIRNNIAAGADKFHRAHIDTLKISCFKYFFKEIGHAENIIKVIFLDCL